MPDVFARRRDGSNPVVIDGRRRLIDGRRRRPMSMRLLLLCVTSSLAACASVGDAPVERYRGASDDEVAGVVTVEAESSAGPFDFSVSFDGRPISLLDDGRREIRVPPGVLFVDVEVSHDATSPLLQRADLVPTRELVPCGRGRVCERTVMRPNALSGNEIREREVICRRGIEILVDAEFTHRVHASTDGAHCRIVCTRVDLRTKSEEDCPEP